MGEQTPWVFGLAALLAAPLFAFLGIWYQARSTRQTAQDTATATVETATAQINADSKKVARETSVEITENLLNRLNTANIDLTARVERYEARVNEQTAELSRLNQRIGGLEADNARLKVENESLRQEIARLADETVRERAEKYVLSQENAQTTARMNEAVRDRGVLAKRVDDLEKEVARLRASIGAERRGQERAI